MQNKRERKEVVVGATRGYVPQNGREVHIVPCSSCLWTNTSHGTRSHLQIRASLPRDSTKDFLLGTWLSSEKISPFSYINFFRIDILSHFTHVFCIFGIVVIVLLLLRHGGGDDDT